MILKTEVQQSTQRALIITPSETIFLKKLIKHLKRMSVEVDTTTEFRDQSEQYDVCIFLQYTSVLMPRLKDLTKTKFIFILFDQDDMAQLYSSYAYEHKLHHVKILNLQTYPEFYEKDLETIFWFAFSRTEDIFLHIYHAPRTSNSTVIKKTKKKKSFKEYFTPKKLIALGILLFLLAQFLFVPSLALSSLSNYRAYLALQSGRQGEADRLIVRGAQSLKTAQSLYQFSSQMLHFFSIALPFEDLFQLNSSASIILQSSTQIRKDASQLADGMFLHDSSPDDTQAILAAKDRLSDNIKQVHDEVTILSEKLPTFTQELKDARQALSAASTALDAYEKIDPHLDSIFARDSEKKYLLLFANNMELRPGGGFIGSFAIADVANYNVRRVTVYDVYDADGQLTSRIEPPRAISEYLNQPFWYLRDSAFTGDFPTNVAQAEVFLAEEMNESEFDGAMLITTTAVKTILSAVDALYIPDYKESITADNFYMKAQLYAEESFFPGSLQKKSFLSSVMNQMMLGLPSARPQVLLEKVQTSLDQKQIVMFSRDDALQQMLESNYWAGSMLEPTCPQAQKDTCVPDFLYQLDANLGINKANFFIQRPTSLKVHIDSKGTITNTLEITYRNDSLEGIFPGGPYKNYFQVHLAPNTQVQSVKVDGTDLDLYDESNFSYKTVGFLMTVAPQEKKVVRIVYRLPTTIVDGKGMYQLILQKQVGSPNYDFSIAVDVPQNMEITRHNLSPLAEGNEILYNTSVSSDKIFLIEYSKN
ncbi:DUF4012 domain-containing protein [Candidatus Woesebacteria bacterium]|nr:DUF4012 domain-containing protein [Candidatus Woesebacteria bacterium]